MRLAAILAVLCTTPLFAAPPAPDFGPNVAIFKPSMDAAEMQSRIDAVYTVQVHNEFGRDRNALLFMPGEYKLNVPIGFYTQAVGLGATPDAVHITGNVHADANSRNNNATTTFWRAAENFAVTPRGGDPENTLQWAVSQAISFRRIHVMGDMVLHQHRGWVSGGFLSDTVIDGNLDSGTQQQWISRNAEWKSWTGSNWNMVFVGVNHPPAGEWPDPPFTKIATVPVIREKPFLQVDSAGRYSVRVPALRMDSTGVTWHSGSTPGKSIPLARFYIAHPEKDTAATINAQLAKGMHLLLTPGIYDLTEPLNVTKPNTVVYGLGLATLHPTTGKAAMTVADADGIIVAGVLFDAGETNSPVLLEVGKEGTHTSHAKNPLSLNDIYFRVGGAGVGKATVSLRINADDTLIDHTWIWRADHGKGVGWDGNTADNGLVVNGNRVTAYGLFVEHYQQYQVLWNGENGRTLFYQSEIPYDPPTQPQYTSGLGVNGWASYKVADNVKVHEAWGMGIYSVFRKPDVVLTRAIEVPDTPGVKFHHLITVCLGNNGEITHVINNTGEATSVNPRVTPKITDYPEKP